MQTLEEAIILATRVHSREVDKGGHPYISHPLRVMLSIQKDYPQINIEILQIAILHDVLETKKPAVDLCFYSQEVKECLELLTRKDNQSYSGYIERISYNPYATLVKLYDLLDNMDLSRIPTNLLTVKDDKRQKKYTKAYTKLHSVLQTFLNTSYKGLFGDNS